MTLSKKPLKIGIFGTAADPPHLGHLAVVKCAARFLDVDKVIVIPTKIPPHKAMSKVSPEHRLVMTHQLFNSTPGVEVSDVELKMPGVSYTKRTIAKLRKMYPNDKLFWIISLETLIKMPKEWREGFGILDYCHFAVLMRNGYKFKDIPPAVLKKVILINNCTSPAVSSTKIRQIIPREENFKKWVGRKLYKYILKNKLYEKI